MGIRKSWEGFCDQCEKQIGRPFCKSKQEFIDSIVSEGGVRSTYQGEENFFCSGNCMRDYATGKQKVNQCR